MRLNPSHSFIFLLLVFSMFSLVSADPPFVQTNIGTDDGLQIFYPAYEYVKVNTPFELNIHITNISNGKEVGSLMHYCYIHLYNKTGHHILEANLTQDSNLIDWEIYIDGGNFSQLGEHSYRIYCDDTFGGEVAGTFMVTMNGEDPVPERLVAFIFMILSIIVLMFFITSVHSKKDFKESEKRIIDNHKNMGETMVKGLLTGLFKNSFIWIYFLGWLIVLFMRELLFEFGSLVVYEYFVIMANIYSLGLLLLTVYMIGYLISYMRNIFSILTDNSWGVER